MSVESQIRTMQRMISEAEKNHAKRTHLVTTLKYMRLDQLRLLLGKPKAKYRAKTNGEIARLA